MDNKIIMGDDTGAFKSLDSEKFLTINNPKYEDGSLVENIKLAELKIGDLPKIEIKNPIFPFSLELTANMTEKLKLNNQVYLKIYDDKDKGKTCEGTALIEAQFKVVY